MIVGSYFEGDNDEKAALRQHAVYGNALGIIESTCNKYARFSRAVLHDSEHENWGDIDHFDHRTMQFSHDLLAAVWRYRHDLNQLELPLVSCHTQIDPQRHWLEWLRGETAKWIDEPWLVRFVLLVLANQKEAVGYKAESELCLYILTKYRDVPWHDRLREVFEKDLYEREES